VNLALLVRWAVIVLAWAYPVAIVGIMAAFWWIGERWWATAVGLYLPRIGFAFPLPPLIIAVWLAGAPRSTWIPVAASVPLLLWLAGFVMPWPIHADPNAPSLRVMSYNVNAEHAGDDAILAQVDKYSPDVLILVEHGSGTIASQLASRYSSVHEETQFVLASRFPVQSSFDPEKLQYYARRRSPRWLEEVLSTPLGPIAVYAVHPMSPRDGINAVRGIGILHKIKAALGLSFSSQDIVAYNSGLRAMQVADFSAMARQEKVPVVIGGDTNLPGLSYLLHHYLSDYQDGFTKAGRGFGYTHPVGQKYGAWMRIDRILASDQLRFVHFEADCGSASDHSCVVADLQRAQP
jgi:endonuclease/exonuclease/phosphatase family metal-dependent hydrolase